MIMMFSFKAKKGGPDGASLVYKVFLRKRPKTVAPMVLRTDNNKHVRRRRYLFSELRNYSTLRPFRFQAIARGGECQAGNGARHSERKYRLQGRHNICYESWYMTKPSNPPLTLFS
jgi:hypothetical protein